MNMSNMPGIRAASAFVAALGLSVTLAACNGVEETSGQTVENDWIQGGPAPTPDVSPTPPPNRDDLYTGAEELQKYVFKFVDDAKIQGVDVLPDMGNPKLEVRIASLDAWGASIVGLCETGSGRRRVTFDPDFWNSVSETQREILAHHELGHCVLNRGHRSTTLASGAYASVMYPMIMSSSSYTGNYDYYQEELFTYAATKPAAGTSASETVHICR